MTTKHLFIAIPVLFSVANSNFILSESENKTPKDVSVAAEVTKKSKKESLPTTVQWTDIENAQEQIKQKENKNKLVFIDCYTDWCGWCKVMDNKTFSDTLIAKMMNYYFVSVKFNAEQRGNVTFNGVTYKYQAQGNRGVNMLAPFLQQNKLSYPSFVVLNADLTFKDMIQGYIEKSEFEIIIAYLGEGYDTKIPYNDFKAKYNTEIRPKILEKIS